MKNKNRKKTNKYNALKNISIKRKRIRKKIGKKTPVPVHKKLSV